MTRLFVTLTVAFALSSQASCAFAAKKARDPLGNFSMVTEGVYRGARPTSEGLEKLARLGVKTIINLQGGDHHPLIPRAVIYKNEPGEKLSVRQEERRQSEALGMNFVNVPLDSIGDVTLEEAEGIDRILKIMDDPKSQPVFVHCEHGKDRTGLVVALYEVEFLGTDPETAHDNMVAHGHKGIHQIFNHNMDEYFYLRTR